MMGFEEVMPLDWPRPEAIPEEARAREVAQRNRENLMRWFQHTFNEVPGRLLCELHLRGME